MSAGCGSDYRLCCLGAVHITSNRDQCNLALRQPYRESDSLLQRATVACAVSDLVSFRRLVCGTHPSVVTE